MKKLIVLCLSLFFVATSFAQQETGVKRWKDVALKMPTEWYGSEEALRVAENVMLYQRNLGGWPKNIEMHLPLTAEQKEKIRDEKENEDTIFDNDATSTQMWFLSKVYAQQPNERIKESFNKGLKFILKAQYKNGGWPMFYPLKEKGYYDRITFNDNAIANILNLLKPIANKEGEIYKMVDAETIKKTKEAYDKGIDCILKCQIVKNGVKTVWCAQHDEYNFKPVIGRPFEYPSFSGLESVGIIRVLMDVENPSKEVIDAVNSAVAWLDTHRIKGMKVVDFTNEKGEKDRKIEQDPTAPDLWARFYDLDKEVPIFGERGNPHILYNLSDITDTKRHTGYQWYGTWAEKLIDKEYPKWKKRIGLAE